MRLLKALVMTMVLLAVGAATASATDICYKDNFNQLLVTKALVLPTANNCKPVNGYKKDSQLVFGGTVCKTWDNTMFVFSLQFGTVEFSPIDGGSLVFWYDPSNSQGFGRWLDWHINDDAGNVGGFTNITITKVTCPSVRKFGLP